MTAFAPSARYGRVIRASIDRFWAECFARDAAPPLGLLVAVEDIDEPVFGIVAGVLTEGIDPSRRITARGEPEHDLRRVLDENPHVPALLATTFETVVVGHARDGLMRQYLPAAPPPILARVRGCSEDECSEFMRSFDFLRLLLAAGLFADDVIAAALRLAAAAQPDRRGFLVRAGKALTPLLADDATRLQAILRRMQP
ncbi:MAG TPA: hypothetical protein VKV26_10340 [Dehalococcoidia bacterium]|nr:hypothetical protein [Dehalococcoidia bacterium]